MPWWPGAHFLLFSADQRCLSVSCTYGALATVDNKTLVFVSSQPASELCLLPGAISLDVHSHVAGIYCMYKKAGDDNGQGARMPSSQPGVLLWPGNIHISTNRIITRTGPCYNLTGLQAVMYLVKISIWMVERVDLAVRDGYLPWSDSIFDRAMPGAMLPWLQRHRDGRYGVRQHGDSVRMTFIVFHYASIQWVWY